MEQCPATPTEVVFIGGRSGVGKTTLANAIHARLSEERVRHCLIDGDFLDMAFPVPWVHGLAERNLAAMWTNYRTLGYRRLIYTNTACVLADEIRKLTAAMGDRPTASAVLLRCSDDTVRGRLNHRESGPALNEHLERSAAMAELLDRSAPNWVHRVDTDARSIADLAGEVITLVGWSRSRALHETDSGD